MSVYQYQATFTGFPQHKNLSPPHYSMHLFSINFTCKVCEQIQILDYNYYYNNVNYFPLCHVLGVKNIVITTTVTAAVAIIGFSKPPLVSVLLQVVSGGVSWYHVLFCELISSRFTPSFIMMININGITE